MMASPSELSLDCKPHSYSMLLKSVGEQSDQTQKLEEFLSRLEEERLKIDAFKRELPLCMQLLTNEMEAYRQQLQPYRANQGPKPILEEFIPLKHASSEGSDRSAAASMSDKASWMTSAQLWSQASEGTRQQSPVTSPKDAEIGFGGISHHPKQAALDNNNNKNPRNGGAFHPFSKDRVSCGQSQALMALPDLALASSQREMDDQKNLENPAAMGQVKGGGEISGGQQSQAGDSQTNNNPNNNNAATNQNHRKARRCWSPDLHRRFVNALQMLGGSQVGTPKQIRELMKVDGLTNDEVKSHLQKYRLHTRRPSPSPQAAPAPAPQLVVLGGIWVPPEYTTAAHAGAPAATLYGPHHPTAHAPAAAHYCSTPGPQEFYPAPNPSQPPHHHHHQLHHHQQLHHHPLHSQLHVYNPPPPQQAQGSLDSDVRGTGDRSESIENGKSESSSWKADSNGENGGDKKVLALREEGGESNASVIPVKF